MMEIRELELSDILYDEEFNCRGKVSPTDPGIISLAMDIDRRGLDNPLVVCESKRAKDKNKKYQLVAGHRRFTALTVLKRKIAPCIVKVMNELEMLVVNLSENVQREDLTVKQEAKGIKQLRDKGMAYTTIAKEIGRSPGWVQTRHMLSCLPEKMQDGIVQFNLGHRHIREFYTVFHKLGECDKLWELYRKNVDGGKVVKANSVIDKPANKKRIRNRSEIEAVQDMLWKHLGPNIINSALGWACGVVSDKDFHTAIKEELSIYGIEYKVPEFKVGGR